MRHQNALKKHSQLTLALSGSTELTWEQLPISSQAETVRLLAQLLIQVRSGDDRIQDLRPEGADHE
jgi:hypothetical protein